MRTSGKRTMNFPIQWLIILFLLLAPSCAQTTNPWDALIPKNSDIIVSEYPESVKSCNLLFYNNIGNYSILASQANNLTSISANLAGTECGVFDEIFFYIALIFVIILLVFGLAIRADMTDWVHVIEFIQEMFIIVTMNIVRESCYYQFTLKFKPAFLVWFTRSNAPRSTNFLRLVFFQSCYFIENVTELAALSSSLFFVYLVIILIDVVLDRRSQDTGGSNRSALSKFLDLFEYGLFIRLGQILILPYIYWTFLGMRVIAFTNVTKTADYALSILYAFFLLAFSCFAVYVINYMPINLESKRMVNRFGGFYAHVRYLKESKLISNEFCIRQSLKMVMASLHIFAYFFPDAVAWSGVFLYGFMMINILVSFWYGGLYKNKFQTFKMAVFHLVIMANYIFALAQAVRTSNEIYIASFLLQLVNLLTILYLIVHCLIFFVLHIMQTQKKDKFKDEDLEETKPIDLNVTSDNQDLRQHGHLQKRCTSRPHQRRHS